MTKTKVNNWAGNVTWQPNAITYPSSEEEIQSLVLKAANDGKKIRVIGTGHSFTALCETHDILLSLDNFQGLVEVNQDKVQATVKGGTKLRLLGDLLFAEGMAMENLGDIDVQSIAGTISTGTHGTGTSFGTISTQVVALKFINGKGESVYCSQTDNQELFKAAQVSLGALGIITEITLQCVPIYKLNLLVKGEPVEEVLSNLSERLSNNRNFEFYWLPHTNKAISKTSNIVENKEVDQVNFFNYWTEYILENHAFKLVNEISYRFLSKTEQIAKLTAALVGTTEKTAYSHKIYATPRLVRFLEMEYNIPAEAYEDVWKEITSAIKKYRFPVLFPIENRWVKGDDIFMSPAYQRDSAYMACHVYHKKNHNPYFEVLEDIFKAHNGRPHWGKMHSLSTQDVIDRYPELNTFLKHRAAQDPDQIFTNAHVQKLLG